MLTGIIAAMSGASALFDMGRDLYAQITGEKPPETPEAFEDAVLKMPEDQRSLFIDQMQKRIEEYQAQTDRLNAEQGAFDANLLSAVPEASRGKIAEMRMTTRPWVVRLMTRVMVWPILFPMMADLSLAVTNSLLAGLQVVHSDGTLIQFRLVSGDFFGSEISLYSRMYQEVVGPASIIILCFMTLRSVIDKKRENGQGGEGLSGIVSGARALLKAFKK